MRARYPRKLLVQFSLVKSSRHPSTSIKKKQKKTVYFQLSSHPLLHTPSSVAPSSPVIFKICAFSPQLHLSSCAWPSVIWRGFFDTPRIITEDSGSLDVHCPFRDTLRWEFVASSWGVVSPIRRHEDQGGHTVMKAVFS